MELNFYQQSVAFLCSIPLGIIIGIFYGIIRFIRTVLVFRKTSTIISDIFFMLISTVMIYLFSIAYIQGYIRIYVFIGSLIGFVLYRCTVGRLLINMYTPVVRILTRTSKIIVVKIKKITKKLLKNIYNILYNVSSKRILSRNKLSITTEHKRDIDFNEGKKA